MGTGGPRPLLPATALVGAAVVFFLTTLYLLADPLVLTRFVGSPRFVALTHAFTLGFVTLVYAGTLQQLPAVMFVTRLVWPRLGYATLSTLFVGSAVLVVGFGAGMRPTLLAAGGTLVSLALAATVLQLLLTAGTRPPRDAASRALLTAAVYLFVTVLLGLLLATVRARPALAAALGYPAALHQYVGLLGAFLLGIGGAGQKLLSMFALSKGGPSWRLRVMAYLVHLCIVALLAGLLGLNDAVTGRVALLALAAACALQCWEVAALLRRRLRKRLEAPVRRYVLGHAFLPVAGLLVLLDQREAAAVAFLLGYVGLAVSGMLVKILSFLTWTAAYAAPAPRAVTSAGAASAPSAPPLLRDLLRQELEPVTTWGLAGGTLATVVAMLTAWQPAAIGAALLLAVGALAQLVQVIHIVVKVNQASGTPAGAGTTRLATGSGQAAS